MSYVAIWLQPCLHWRCAYFQTLSWNDTIFVLDWDILYKLCGSANKWSKGFVFSGKIWWQFFSCNKACSKYHTQSTTTPKYTLTQRLVAACSAASHTFNEKSFTQRVFLTKKVKKLLGNMEWNNFVISLSIKKTVESRQNNGGKGKTEGGVSFCCAFCRSYFAFHLSLSLYWNRPFYLNSLIFNCALEQTVKITYSSWITSYPYPHLCF